MRKKTGIRNLVLLGIFLVVGLVLSFVRFTIPFTTYDYVGFARALNVGHDLGDGVEITLTANNKDDSDTFNDDFDDTYRFIDKMIKDRFNVYSVTANGHKSIQITLPYSTNNYDFLSVVGTSHELTFSTASDGSNPFMTGKNIRDIYAQKQQGNWGVVIEFDDEGREGFGTVTEDVTMYIHLDDQVVSQMSVSSTVTSNSIFISGSMNDWETANIYACRLLTGKYTVNISSVAPTTVSPSLGENALLMLSIASLVAVVLMLVALVVLYKWLGVVAGANILTFGFVMLMILALLPKYYLTLTSFIGIVFGFAMAFVSSLVILERIKSEYAKGKKLNASYRFAYQKSLWQMLDFGAVIAILSVIAVIFGKGQLWIFGLTSLVAVILSTLSTLLLLRAYIYSLICISKKSKGLGMYRKEGVDEIA